MYGARFWFRSCLPLRFNDMNDEVDSYMSFFANDAKLLRKVCVENDCEVLQQDLSKLWNWCNE